MSFLFATSHLPAVKRPQDAEDEEDEDNAQPMQRSGGVRAISHLEEADSAPETRSFTSARSTDSAPPAHALGTPTGPLSQRGAQPAGRSLFMTPRPTPPQFFAQLQARRAATKQQLPPTTAAATAPGQGDTPTILNLQQRNSDQPPAQLLAQPAPAKTGARQHQPSPAAGPIMTTPPAPQTSAPGPAPKPAPKPAPEPGPAVNTAQSPAAKVRTPQSQLTKEELEELATVPG